MPGADRYSRLVAAATVVLPLLALAILSTLFLAARRIDTEAAIPYAEVDVRAVARDQRIGQPRHATMTADGSAITLTAALALPEDERLAQVRMEEVVAQIDLPDGTVVGITAPVGRLDTPGGVAELTGGTVVTLSTGWRAETASLAAALDTTRLVAETRIEATGPVGTVTAGRMELTQGQDPDSRRPVLLFTGGVRLLYDPGR